MPDFDVQRTLRDYTRILLRRKWLFVVPFVLALVVTGYVFVKTPKRYKATGIVRRENPVLLKDQAKLLERVAEDTRLAKSRLTQRNELIRILVANKYGINFDRQERFNLEPPGGGDPAWEAALNEADWDKIYNRAGGDGTDTGQFRRGGGQFRDWPRRWHRIITHPEWSKVIPRLRRRVEIRASASSGATQYIYISYTDEDPELARKVCAALIDSYILGGKSVVKDRLLKTRKTLQSQLQEVSRKLEEANAALADFEQQYLGNLPKNAVGIDKELKTRKSTTHALARQVEVAERVVQRLQEELARTPRTIVTSQEHIRNPRLDEIEEEIRSYRAELRKLRLRYTDEHPRIKELRRLIQDAEQEMASLPTEVVGSRQEGPNPAWQRLSEELAARQQQLAELQDRLAASRQELDALEARKVEIVNLYRRHGTLKQACTRLARERQRLVDQLDQNEQDLKVHEWQQGIRYLVQEEPVRPVTPSWPDPVVYLIFGILAGTAAGTGFVILAEHLDHSLRTVSEARRYLRVPVVGTVGLIRTRAQKRLRLGLRILRWTLAAALVGGAVGGYIWANRHPYYHKIITEFARDPAATIHRWTGAPANLKPSVGSLQKDLRFGNLVLTAKDVFDPEGTVLLVEFYRDKDGDGRLDPRRDERLGKDVSPVGGWSWSGSVTAWPRGVFVCFARARDVNGAWSNVVSVRGRVGAAD